MVNTEKARTASHWTPDWPVTIYDKRVKGETPMAKPVAPRSGAMANSDSVREVDSFLQSMAMMPTPSAGQRGRLIFAMDATASREPTWDIACDIQAEMFAETDTLGGLEVQLVFYRGIGECRSTKWLSCSNDLVDRMVKVRCLGGRTQVGRVLKHAVKEARKASVGALVLVGDAFEEAIDPVCEIAGQLGLLGTRAFLFQEGDNPEARRAFRQIARLTGGACCRFDAGSARQLRDLLSAVAVYAAGGRQALENFAGSRGGAARQITSQISGKD
ncbi:MAG: VWA domain-containing protein [Rhodospirillaceae bacterium]|nr:VWA domain-containing protein [Rhodospirillaceae bacterium]